MRPLGSRKGQNSLWSVYFLSFFFLPTCARATERRTQVNTHSILTCFFFSQGPHFREPKFRLQVLRLTVPLTTSWSHSQCVWGGSDPFHLSTFTTTPD